MDRIFEPYYTTKEQGKGTGLGLSVIHGIVKNHRGDINVKSTPGKGTIFQVYLPLIEYLDIGVELEPTDGETKGEGYRVTARTDSQEALKVFAEQPHNFDLVITDMTMPHMTGDQLAQKMLDIEPNIPVILCTGFNEVITEDKALAMGIQKFVMKPIVKNDLATTIRTLLDQNPSN
jgi:CheY-like chemotaxis protein